MLTVTAYITANAHHLIHSLHFYSYIFGFGECKKEPSKLYVWSPAPFTQCLNLWRIWKLGTLGYGWNCDWITESMKNVEGSFILVCLNEVIVESPAPECGYWFMKECEKQEVKEGRARSTEAMCVPRSICHPGCGLWWHLVHLRNRLFEMQGSIEQIEAGPSRKKKREGERGVKHEQFSLPISAPSN